MDRRDEWAGHGSARSVRRHVLVAGSAIAVLLGGLAPLAAPSTALTPQSEQTWETGVISSVADGDTVSVEVQSATDPGFIAPADPALRSYCAERLTVAGTMPLDDNDLDGCRVRLSGIQAPEKAGASGGSALQQCHADAARAALEAVLPPGTQVQLRSISIRSVEDGYSGGRLARSVYYQDGAGQWVDAGRAVLTGGHAMWFPHSVGDLEKPEYAHNLEYRRLVDAAAARGAGLWSAGYCGTSAPAAVRTWVVSDPIGDDANNEYMVVLNDSDAALDISGWTVRDSSLTTFTFPPGTLIGPRDHVRVLTGQGAPGTPTARDFHFGGPSQMFANWDPAAGYFYGDGAYVYDAQPGFAYGNLRAWFHYPCDPDACTDPLVGRVVIGAVQYNPSGTDTAAGEYIEFRNTTPSAVSLGGYAFGRQGSQYPFPPATSIAAGGTLRLSMGVGADTPDTLFLGRTASLLANAGDRLTLVNLNHAPVDCRAWGAFSCAGMPVSGPLTTPASAPAAAPAPASAPVTVARTNRPAAPSSVLASSSSKRVTVRWAAPAPNGTKKVTKYRAKVYLKSGKALKYRTSCTAKSKTLKCRTKKLLKGRTYVVKIQARNSKGYGPFSAPASVRVR
ncbi:MAG TPA: lamin tail domain-containing protein [Motilibacterales bacterium]|nr:lamin tail domain-containing protein [Motilibacterales bacterium]